MGRPLHRVVPRGGQRDLLPCNRKTNEPLNPGPRPTSIDRPLFVKSPETVRTGRGT
ncbi:hypothetical protein FRUB_03998 [Fimbriiglobus ruber]|uniref:Uncharacterized protein n=1 Tax=Fimbriiglobus ruber TaxID=1908690 RepID=A0A225DKB8_9BACT|nr:hypothetical protein FRUB_03998 [Fimbriiglobus ruber]